ncbi:cupin-like domain-containing protein [Massilia sp. IC2-477]|uniref:cupin-like domain-containing protein n=1 Tax=Massilia sp. IC2-477 TaxID=2887198 RepID=UPI001D10A062|nr:cupin-like domain-containing protein [Massilia sp. IC2-477]MCC2957069.1 cupin-like domain-containing protein [Massilia sp. IC2-477]
MLPEPAPIRELDGRAPGVLGDALLSSTEPVVLRGLTSSWPMVARSRASQGEAGAYLRRFYRGEQVLAFLGAPEMAGRYFYNADLSGFNYAAIKAPLDKVLEELEDHRDDVHPPSVYVGSTMIDHYLPGFRTENDLDLGARQPLVSIWIGNRSRIAAHYDVPDNIAVVAAGRRRFTLFPPEQVSNLYIGPLDFTPAGQAISLVDFAKPDLQRFPRFAQAVASARAAELGPGDAIFIPSMWWHHIEALEPFNVLVNYWWRQSPPHMDSPAATLMLALLTLRELPPAQRRAWQELLRHYVFDSDGSEAVHIPPAARGVLAPLDAESARALRMQLLKRLNR